MGTLLSGKEIYETFEWEGRYEALINYIEPHQIEDNKLRQLIIQAKELDNEITERLKEIYPNEEWEQ